MAVMKMHENKAQDFLTNVLNHLALAFVTGALFCDVIKMNFGLDPAVAEGNATSNMFGHGNAFNNKHSP